MHDLPHISAAMNAHALGTRGRPQVEGNLAVPTNTKSNQATDPQPRSGQPNLDQRYGKIGIPALKAVLRYASPVKNLVSSTTIRVDERFVEHAA